MLVMPLLMAQAEPTLVTDLGLAASYQSNDAANPTAAFNLTINTDGTYTIAGGPGDIITGTPITGNWVQPAFAGVGQYFQVQFVISNQVNTPTETNDASSYTTITSNLTVGISKGGAATASADLRVNLKPLGAGATVLTELTNAQVDGT